MKKKIIPDIIDQQDCVVLDPTTSIHDAVQMMSTHHISAIGIADADQKLIGIVTEGDMTHRVLSCGLNPQATHVSAVMTNNPVTLAPGDAPIDAIELMLKRNIRHLPVLNEAGQIIAMVSMRNLMLTLINDLNSANDTVLNTAFAPS